MCIYSTDESGPTDAMIRRRGGGAKLPSNSMSFSPYINENKKNSELDSGPPTKRKNNPRDRTREANR